MLRLFAMKPSVELAHCTVSLELKTEGGHGVEERWEICNGRERAWMADFCHNSGEKSCPARNLSMQSRETKEKMAHKEKLDAESLHPMPVYTCNTGSYIGIFFLPCRLRLQSDGAK